MSSHENVEVPWCGGLATSGKPLFVTTYEGYWSLYSLFQAIDKASEYAICLRI